MTTMSSDCSEQIRQKSDIPRSYLEVPTVGIEPTTYWLQNNCSANWAKSACGVSECGSFRGNENWKHSDTCGWLNRESEPDTKYRIDEKNVLAKCQKQESNLYYSASSFDLSPATRLTIQKMDSNHTDGTSAALPRVLTYKTTETSGNGG